MKKSRIIVMTMFVLMLSITLFSLRGPRVSADTPANVGELNAADVTNFGWLASIEDEVKGRFVAAYEAEEWTQPATSDVVAVEFDKSRHAMFQVYGEEANFEGALILNDISSEHLLVITDPLALAHLQTLHETGSNGTNAILLDVIESGGDT